MKHSLILCFLCSCCLLRAEDCPTGSAPGTGVSDESGWKNNLEEQIWKTKVGVGFSTVSVAKGRLYTMGHDGRKSGEGDGILPRCKDGQVDLTHSYPAPSSTTFTRAVPAQPYGGWRYRLRLEQARILHAYQASDGEILWKKDMMKEAE